MISTIEFGGKGAYYLMNAGNLNFCHNFCPRLSMGSLDLEILWHVKLPDFLLFLLGFLFVYNLVCLWMICTVYEFLHACLFIFSIVYDNSGGVSRYLLFTYFKVYDGQVNLYNFLFHRGIFCLHTSRKRHHSVTSASPLEIGVL